MMDRTDCESPATVPFVPRAASPVVVMTDQFYVPAEGTYVLRVMKLPTGEYRSFLEPRSGLQAASSLPG